MNLLDLLIAIPGIGIILTLLIPRRHERAIRLAGWAVVGYVALIIGTGVAHG